MKVLSTLTAVLLISVAALAQDKPRGTQLKNADLTQTFASGTITIGDWSVLGLSDARLYLRGGILHVVYSDPDGNGNYSPGKWRIDQDTLCITWQSAPGGGCGTVFKLADGSYETWHEGKRVYAFRVRPPPTPTALKPPR